MRRPEILLIEDNPDHVEIFTTLLKMGGIRGKITVFCEGNSALKYLKQSDNLSRNKVVILDLKLPGKSGIAILEELKKNMASSLKVILLSSMGSGPEIERARALGVTHILDKGSALENFVEIVREVLREMEAEGGDNDGIPQEDPGNRRQ